MRMPARLGALAGALTFAADQGSKFWSLRSFDLPYLTPSFDLALPDPVVLGPFVNLIVVWNRGISYGLFQQHSDMGRWLLLLVSVVATIAISVWMARTESRLLAVALGLIAGGAIGNVVDRVAYEAVFDFIQLHIGSRSWYVFNVADAAIVAGVVGLIYDSLPIGRRQPRNA